MHTITINLPRSYAAYRNHRNVADVAVLPFFVVVVVQRTRKTKTKTKKVEENERRNVRR